MGSVVSAQPPFPSAFCCQCLNSHYFLLIFKLIVVFSPPCISDIEEERGRRSGMATGAGMGMGQRAIDAVMGPRQVRPIAGCTAVRTGHGSCGGSIESMN